MAKWEEWAREFKNETGATFIPDDVMKKHFELAGGTVEHEDHSLEETQHENGEHSDLHKATGHHKGTKAK